ncbi:MAG TPA: hypothetical protein VF774_18260, partial [Pseudoduganella sp.]
GDVIVARVLGTTGDGVPASFGVRLDRDTLGANRQRIAHERTDCATHQAMVFEGVAREVAREQAREQARRATPPAGAEQHAGLAAPGWK